MYIGPYYIQTRSNNNSSSINEPRALGTALWAPNTVYSTALSFLELAKSINVSSLNSITLIHAQNEIDNSVDHTPNTQNIDYTHEK